MRIPELLAPAGDLDALRAALHFGADAVYGGMKRFGLRAFAGNFGPDDLAEAVKLTHSAGKKFYVTLNSFPFDDEMEEFVSAAALAAETGVDAAIVADPGPLSPCGGGSRTCRFMSAPRPIRSTLPRSGCTGIWAARG
jgi:Collagenase and related proteases